MTAAAAPQRWCRMPPGKQANDDSIAAPGRYDIEIVNTAEPGAQLQDDIIMDCARVCRGAWRRRVSADRHNIMLRAIRGVAILASAISRREIALSLRLSHCREKVEVYLLRFY